MLESLVNYHPSSKDHVTLLTYLEESEGTAEKTEALILWALFNASIPEIRILNMTLQRNFFYIEGMDSPKSILPSCSLNWLQLACNLYQVTKTSLSYTVAYNEFDCIYPIEFGECDVADLTDIFLEVWEHEAFNKTENNFFIDPIELGISSQDPGLYIVVCEYDPEINKMRLVKKGSLTADTVTEIQID